jgi:hypothetical protein
MLEGFLSPSNTQLPVAPVGAAAKITVQGRFLQQEVYEMSFRDANQNGMSVLATALQTTKVDNNQGLVFDLTGALWAFSHAATTIRIKSVSANSPIWQRVCLKTSCGLAASGALRERGLSPTIQGSLVRFNFTTDSHVFNVPTKETPSFQPDPLPAIPDDLFLGAASSASMQIDGANWLAVANFWNGKDYFVPSKLLNLDSLDSGTVQVQQVYSHGARQWAKVDVSSVPGLNFSTLLVLANYLSPSLLIPWKPPPFSMLDTENTVELGSELGASAVKVLNISGCQHIGTQFTCFTGTKVQILTPEELQSLPFLPIPTLQTPR